MGLLVVRVVKKSKACESKKWKWRLPKLATNPLDTEAIIRSQKILEMVDYLSLSILIKYVLNYVKISENKRKLGNLQGGDLAC